MIKVSRISKPPATFICFQLLYLACKWSGIYTNVLCLLRWCWYNNTETLALWNIKVRSAGLPRVLYRQAIKREIMRSTGLLMFRVGSGLLTLSPLFSFAFLSSSLQHPGKVHLVFNVVEFPARPEHPARKGLCTGWLVDHVSSILEPCGTAPALERPGTSALPKVSTVGNTH